METFRWAEEGVVQPAVQWLRLGVETIGALVVAAGIFVAAIQLVRSLAARRGDNFTSIRLTLARYLALALEFQLGADILSTAIAPTWQQIGQLGAIAVIRTALNFFLGREMREESETLRAERDSHGRAQGTEPPAAGASTGTST